jgi:hypothetical protein
MAMRPTVGSFALTLFLAGCSARSAGTPAPDASSCAGAWGNLLPPQTDGTSPTDIVWSGGTLYYELFAIASGIYALDEGGSTPRLLTTDLAQRLWLDGDRLLYAAGDKFFAVSLAGGSPTVVAAGNTIQANGAYAGVFQTIDSDFFYWALMRFGAQGTTPGTVWRMARAGGVAQPLGELAGVSWDTVRGVAAIGDVIVVAYSEGSAVAVPKAGGPPRELVASAGLSFVGFDDRGALYSRVDGPNGPFSVVRTEADGGPPGTFWPTMPPSFLPDRIFGVSDGWIVSGAEMFSDATIRFSIWWVDSTGSTGRRIGCMTDGSLVYVSAAAAAPSAAFLSVEHLPGINGNSPVSWNVVRLAR